MINRDDLSPEDRDVYDKSYLGAVDRLDREVQALKRAIYEASPRPFRWLFRWLTR